MREVRRLAAGNRRAGRRCAITLAGAAIAVLCTGCWHSTSGRDLRPPAGASGAVIGPVTTTSAPLILTTVTVIPASTR